MKPRCPHCGTPIDPESAWHEGLWWEALGLLARFGRAAPLVLEYTELFRLSVRGLSLTRRIKVLKEILPLWETGKYTWKGYTYKAERPQIVEALQGVLGANTIEPPLANHNYLKKVLHPLAQRREADRERATEEARRAGRWDDDGPKPRRLPVKPPKPPKPEVLRLPQLYEKKTTVFFHTEAPKVETPEASEEVKSLLAQGKSWEAVQLMAKEKRQRDEENSGAGQS